MEDQEKKHPLDRMMRETLEHVRAMADTNTIIGTPIHAEGVTLIPVSRMSIGVGGGGTQFSTKQQTGDAPSFGGGSGASAKLEPVAFLVVREGGVKLLPVSPAPSNTIDRVIEAVPEVVDKITAHMDRQREKKDLAD